MRWSRWKKASSATTASSLIIVLINFLIIKVSIVVAASQNFKISPKPCIVGGIDGTCMFVLECIRSEGRHLGMCMDGFMFGSCCAHNLTDNFIFPPSTPFRPPNKPTNKYKPTKNPISDNKPNSYGTLTIQRPNGSGTLVIRQPQNPQKPFKTKTTTTKASIATTRKPFTTKNPLDNFNDSSNELTASSSSVSASKHAFYKFLNFSNTLIYFFTILNRFLVINTMASDDGTKFHHKTTSVTVG